MTSIFLDTNVFMYVLGGDHPLRLACARVLDIATFDRKFFTNAEVMQEILHRYVAENRWVVMQPFVEPMYDLMESRVVEMIVDDTREAGELALLYPALPARDLVHVAIMRRVDSTHIVSADKDFDSIDGIERLDPMRVDEWQSRVTAN